MKALEIKDINDFDNFLKGFRLDPFQRSIESFCGDDVERTEVLEKRIEDHNVRKYVNEFWTSKQRQANSIHEISYRACFKPQLPNFFIRLLTKQKDIVYDPFSGRGTTAIEAALLNRNIAANDINPLSEILTAPRLNPPFLKEVELRLKEISLNRKSKADIDLTMFYYPDTEGEIVSLKSYLTEKKESGNEDKTDKWIRMIATNRLTGHSRGFFSVYTLPPNQAVSPERQETINKMRDQKPEYRNIKKIILGKSKSLLRDLTNDQKNILNTVYLKRLLLTEMIIEPSHREDIY